MKKITTLLFSLACILAGQAQEKKLTTNTGAPVGDNQNSQTAGATGPVLCRMYTWWKN